MKWKIVVGTLLIVGPIMEMLSIISDYLSGKLRFWPFGVEIGLVALIVLGIYLIRKGRKEKETDGLRKL